MAYNRSSAQVMLVTIILYASYCASKGNDLSTPTARFQSYLRINTAHPKPDYTSAVSFLDSFSRSINLTVQILHFSPKEDKPVLLVSWVGSDPSLPSIFFNSHMDSVPANPSEWIHDPFTAHKDASGRIFARGAQDDKCISVQQLEAIWRLKARGFNPIRTIHISYVPEEELGGKDGAEKLFQSPEFEELKVGLVVGEGQASTNDEYRIFFADRQPWTVLITAKGDPGHGSSMYENGAVENILKSMELINNFRESQFDMVKSGRAMNSEVVSINPVYIKAGVPSPSGFVMNVQPSEAEVGLDLRIPPTVDPEVLEKKIAEEWAPSWRNLSYKIHKNGAIRDYMGRPLVTATDNSNPWWGVFQEAISAAGGKLSKPEILASSTDVVFARRLGLPAFGFSPMKNTPILLHQNNEFLTEETFLKGIDVYEHLIVSLSSFPEHSSM